jgi:hypothetical protein
MLAAASRLTERAGEMVKANAEPPRADDGAAMTGTKVRKQTKAREGAKSKLRGRPGE